MLSPLLMSILLLVPAGPCVDDKVDSKLLVGKWQPEKLPEGVEKLTVEFHKDQKVSLEVEAQGSKQKFEGTYKVDGNMLNVKMEINGNTQDQKRKIVKLTESEFVTKDEEMNMERKYKKVK